MPTPQDHAHSSTASQWRKKEKRIATSELYTSSRFSRIGNENEIRMAQNKTARHGLRARLTPGSVALPRQRNAERFVVERWGQTHCIAQINGFVLKDKAGVDRLKPAMHCRMRKRRLVGRRDTRNSGRQMKYTMTNNPHSNNASTRRRDDVAKNPQHLQQGCPSFCQRAKFDRVKAPAAGQHFYPRFFLRLE